MEQRLFLRVGIGGVDAGCELLQLVQNSGFAVCVEWQIGFVHTQQVAALR